jgi:hypothetical protein
VALRPGSFLKEVSGNRFGVWADFFVGKIIPNTAVVNCPKKTAGYSVREKNLTAET